MAAAKTPTASASAGMQLTVPTAIAAVVFVVVLLLAGYYTVFYAPLAESIRAELSRRGTLESELARARRDERQYNDDVAELNQRRAHARELARVLPDDADMPGFMRNINTLAESSGLQIGLIQPTDEQVEQHYVRVPVRLELTGSYLALARFFRAVSQLPRVINMENITLEQPEEQNGEVRLRAKVLATAFRSRREGEGGQPAAAPGAPAAQARGGRR